MHRHIALFVVWLSSFHCMSFVGCASSADAAQPPPSDNAPSPAPAGTSQPEADARPTRRFAGYQSVSLSGIPHIKQRPDFCGEACVAMVLAKLGHVIDQDDVFDQSGLDPVLGRGCYTRDLKLAVQRIGFQPGAVWYQSRSDRDLETRFREMHADLLQGIPSIICMHYDDQPETTEHFRLVVGYDDRTDEILYHEPAVGRGAYRRMSCEQLMKLWPLSYDANYQTIIRLRMKAGDIRDVHSGERVTNADYAHEIIRLKRMAPDDFTFVIERPFVVLGDEGPEGVQRWASGTIRWAIQHLKSAYFTKDPNEILAIWLFKDRESYSKHVTEVFGRAPHTPFGYYSHRDRALIMNIDTGGGTLVHEIVHPFMAANFPECPAWFNEGLASLYEQCGTNRGRIWGYTNWRLAGLQAVIQPPVPEEEPEGETPGGGEASPEPSREPPPPPELPSFKTLCGTTTYQFYAEDPGTNYSQARYLCYYLQHRGLLGKYYRAFRDNVDQDPTGYETLKAVLGHQTEAEMDQFTEAWKQWIMTLRFP